MEEICENCGHSKSLHPSCTLCDCKTFQIKEEILEEERQTKGPASEVRKDDWCIDCGHNIKVHAFLHDETHKCNYWTDRCECTGFVSRSEALIAVRKAGGFISKTETLVAIQKLEQEIREG